jgi:hypothetical protein
MRIGQSTDILSLPEIVGLRPMSPAYDHFANALLGGEVTAHTAGLADMAPERAGGQAQPVHGANRDHQRMADSPVTPRRLTNVVARYFTTC